jgi:hypothetical protein
VVGGNHQQIHLKTNAILANARKILDLMVTLKSKLLGLSVRPEA